MKVAIYFEPQAKKDNFEGTRLRKNIKGALELENIPYAKNLLDSYELVHFLSVKDEFKILDHIESGVPVVFSALMCESDDNAKIMEIKNGVNTISPRAIKVLNKVNRIFVSDETSKNLLLRAGVETKISIVTPGVNTARFEFTNKSQDEIFFQYYQIEPGTKFVVSIGSYEEKETVQKFIEIAKKCPQYRFFYFGPDASEHHLYRLSKKLPANIKLSTIMNDEVYCSMMKQAGIYLSLDNTRHAPITMLDAAASKTQIIALKPLGYNEEILKEMRAYACEDADEIVKTIVGVFEGKIPSTTKEAYKIAKQSSLANLGKMLRKEYEEVIMEVKEND